MTTFLLQYFHPTCGQIIKFCVFGKATTLN